MAIGSVVNYGLPFSNVVASGTATNQITRGKTLNRFQLKLGGTLTKAMITRFKMKANGGVVIDATGTQIDKINAYRGANTTNAGFLDIFFKDFSLNNEFDRGVGAFDTTMGIADLTTEVTIAGATAPVLTPILFQTAAQKLKTGEAAPYAALICKLLNYPYSVSTGGTLPINLPFGNVRGSVIKRIHIFHTGQLTGVTMKQDSTIFYESLKAENEFIQTSFGRVPQTNMYTIDFVVDGDIKNALDTRDAKSLELLCNFSGADVGEVLVEYIDPLGNL